MANTISERQLTRHATMSAAVRRSERLLVDILYFNGLLIILLQIATIIFYWLTITSARQLVYMLETSHHIDVPKNWIDSEMVGYDWLQFVKRHPGLSVHRASAEGITLLAWLQSWIQSKFKTILIITIIDTTFWNSS